MGTLSAEEPRHVTPTGGYRRVGRDEYCRFRCVTEAPVAVTDRRMPTAEVVLPVRVRRDDRVGYALFVGFAAAVLLASVVDPPTGAGVDPVPRLLGLALDKWVHAGTYAVLAGLLCYATGARAVRAVLLAVVVVATYGLAIELVQATLPARSFELADVAANTVGAALATLAWRVRHTLARR
jgi:hypothetical protein